LANKYQGKFGGDDSSPYPTMLQAVINHLSSHYKILSYPSRLASFVPSPWTQPVHPVVVEKIVPPSPVAGITTKTPSEGQLVWLITGKSGNAVAGLSINHVIGTSTGFGRRLVNAALLRGDLVIATVRSLNIIDPNDITVPEPLLQNLRRIELDVTEGEEALRVKVDEAAAIWGRIDVLVNNAGKRSHYQPSHVLRSHWQRK
jgi:short chain dehydrogenase